MASFLDYLGTHHHVYDQWSHANQSTVHVSQIVETVSDKVEDLSCENFDADLSALESLLSENDKMTLEPDWLLQVIWIERVVQPRLLNVDFKLFTYIHAALGHHEAFHGCSTMLAGIGSTSADSAVPRVHYLSFLPKLSMTWSRDASTNRTTVICVAESGKIQALQNLLRQAFIQQLHKEAMLPALLVAILFSIEIDTTQANIAKEVRQVEVRTGHHNWKSRAENPALGDLVHLTATMSGCSGRMASCIRKQKTLRDIYDAILDDRNSNSLSQLASTLNTIKRRRRAHEIDSDFMTQRIRTQLEALYHLINQNDAFSAQEMAQDTRLIAVASQRDSSSMKIIAVVTMFFLPGTFVSSLLGIPLFDWDGGSHHQIFRSSYNRPIILTFIAITLPLMAVVFAIWGIWMLHRYARERVRLTKSLAKLNTTLSEDEVRRLAYKRRTLSSEMTN